MNRRKFLALLGLAPLAAIPIAARTTPPLDWKRVKKHLANPIRPELNRIVLNGEGYDSRFVTLAFEEDNWVILPPSG